jgi:two-component system NtrC family sensor kinase
MAGFFDKLRPKFLYETVLPGGEKALFNYRRIWRQAILSVAGVALVPLLVLTIIHHLQYRKALTAEIFHPVTRFVSNTQWAISSFLEERRVAMDFVVRDNNFGALSDQDRLAELLGRMKESFGDFADLGVIDDRGTQVAYVGPFDLRGKDYSSQKWFRDVQQQGLYVSEVFRGYRDVPHFVIAARHAKAGGSFYVVRATIDAARLTAIIRSLENHPESDAFLINDDGILQTDSLRHGRALDRCPLHVPPPSAAPEVTEIEDAAGNALVLGYARIERTPFILVVTKKPEVLMKGWWELRSTLLVFLVFSALGILGVVVVAVTYLVGRVYEADFKRTVAVHKMEHTNKMASVGRLAAGVAHEINNPLAIINEKAGLCRDLLTIAGAERSEARMLEHVGGILRAVERCSTITRRLLGFAKHVDVVFQVLDLEEVVREVLGLLGREAQHRNIAVTVTAPEGVPRIRSDRGQLQQVFLNIINNAFDAVKDGGRIDIAFEIPSPQGVSVVITDDGCGIPPEHLQRIFEPFYTTKKEKGTGLGLSITYGLVQKLGGGISVRSDVGQGTSFRIGLPVEPPAGTETRAEGEDHAHSARG